VSIVFDRRQASTAARSIDDRHQIARHAGTGCRSSLFDLAQARRDAGDAALVVAEPMPQALGEGTVALLEDDAGRERMRNYGREHARSEFQWEIEKRSLLAAYARLAQRRARAHARKAGTPADTDAPESGSNQRPCGGAGELL
jgi:hypothetical protein